MHKLQHANELLLFQVLLTFSPVSVALPPDQIRLFIAKFVDSNKNNKWHGYPANHVKNNQDIPPEEILLKWVNAQYIRMALVRKLIGGKKCKL